MDDAAEAEARGNADYPAALRSERATIKKGEGAVTFTEGVREDKLSRALLRVQRTAEWVGAGEWRGPARSPKTREKLGSASSAAHCGHVNRSSDGR